MSVSNAPSSCAPPRGLVALILGVAALAFASSLRGGFLADDFVYIARFRELPWSEWPHLFTHEWSGGIWGQPLRELRPFAALSMMGDARLFGGDPLGYRLTNLALHLLATFFIIRLAWHYSGGRPAAVTIAGLIFGLHPAHAEAVAWITGRVDMLASTSALLYLLAAEFFAERGRRAHFVVAVLMLFVGIFSKELCMFAPLLLLLRWLLTDFRAARSVWVRRAAILGGSIVIILFYAACRRAAFGHDGIGYNVWTDVPAWHRQASYAAWFVPFLPFSRHSELQSFPSLTVLHGVWIALGIATIVALVIALRRGARQAALVIFFGGVWFFVTVAPLTAVVYHAPRHLYFPTAGLALAIGLACAATRTRLVLGAALVAWCIVGHAAALQPWRKAANVSRDALAALDRELAQAGSGAVAVTSVPPTLGPVWMWAWSSPQSTQAPFLAHPPAQVIEHPVTYSRAGGWFEVKRPLETVRAAPAIVALWVDEQGRIACRRIPAAEIPARADTLAQTITRGLSPESWTDWVKSAAAP